MKRLLDEGFLQWLVKNFKIGFLCCLLVLLCFVPISGRIIAIGSGQNAPALVYAAPVTPFPISGSTQDQNGTYYVVRLDMNFYYNNVTGQHTGNFNQIWKSVDQGTTWTYVSTVPNSQPESSELMYCTDKNTLVFVDGYINYLGGVWRSADGGVTWTETYVWNSSVETARDIFEDGHGNIYIAEYSCGDHTLGHANLLRSADDGMSWNVVHDWTGNRHLHGVYVNPYNGWIYVALGEYTPIGLERSEDNGTTWTLINQQQLWASIMGRGDSNEIYLGSDTDGKVYTLIDDGSSNINAQVFYNPDAVPGYTSIDGRPWFLQVVNGRLVVGTETDLVGDVDILGVSDSSWTTFNVVGSVVTAKAWHGFFPAELTYWPITKLLAAYTCSYAVSVQPPPTQHSGAQPLFSDGFESGNFAGWSNGLNTAANGTGNVTTAMPNEGLYAANLSQASQSGSYARVDESLLTAQQTLYVRAYFYFNSLSIASGNAERLCRVKSSVYGSTAFFGLANNSGTMEFYIQDATNSSWTYDTADKVTTGTYYSVEMKVYVGVGATDGDVVLWVNGVQRAERTGMNLVQYGNSNEVQLGCVVMGGSGNVAVQLQLDSVVIDNSYIGPISARVFLFSDDFESGNFSAGGWTTAATGSGTSSVSQTNPYQGLYSAKFTANVPDTADMRIGGWALSSMNVRAYFYFSTMPLSGQFWNILMIRDSNTNAVVRLRIGNGTSLGTYWQLTYVNGGQTGIITNYTSISANTWYCLEIGGVRNAVNGSASYWVNGNLMASVQGLNDTSFGSYYGSRMGIQYSGSGTQSITMYVDNVVVDSSYIGTVQP